MRKVFILLLCLCTIGMRAQTTAGRAQKPIIMVVPEKAWCINQGYSSDGKNIDYARALTNDDILNVITKMGDIMVRRGYPLKLLSSTLDEISTEATMDMALTSKGDGEIVEDDLDQLARVAGADILVNIAFTRSKVGPRQTMEFRVTSVDAATSKQIAG